VTDPATEVLRSAAAVAFAVTFCFLVVEMLIWNALRVHAPGDRGVSGVGRAIGPTAAVAGSSILVLAMLAV
jgi:hypothetical protein